MQNTINTSTIKFKKPLKSLTDRKDAERFMNELRNAARKYHVTALVDTKDAAGNVTGNKTINRGSLMLLLQYRV